MIKVEIGYSANRDYKTLLVTGHADYAEKGKDLICAAVSSILIGMMNNLKEIDSYKYEIDEGYINLDFQNKITEHDHIVIETCICQLKTIEFNYNKYIKIIDNRKE